jgi:hypothetical protein
MTRRWLVVCLASLALGVSCRTRAAGLVPEEGDLVFETSGSQQSAAIQWATRSRWSHVGIVERRGSEVAVIEALGKVSRTPWRAWTRRALRGGPYLVLRPRDLGPAQRAAAVAEARRFLGRPYDARFGWSDDRVYCSELVVKAYQRGAGVTLGKLERLGDLRLTGIEGAMERRWGGPIPRDLRLVTPASLAEDPRLAPVR